MHTRLHRPGDWAAAVSAAAGRAAAAVLAGALVAGHDDAADVGQEVLPGLVRQHHEQVAVLVLGPASTYEHHSESGGQSITMSLGAAAWPA